MCNTHFYKFRCIFRQKPTTIRQQAGKPVKDNTNHPEIESISKREYLMFSFLEFRFFWNSPNGKALLFGNPSWLAPLIVIPYTLVALVYNYGGTKYLIKQKNEVAGILVLKARQNALIVHTLAVSQNHRKHGIGLFILSQAENLAKRMKLQWLELVVLKRNTPAQRLYEKFGFKIHAERRLSLVLRKRV